MNGTTKARFSLLGILILAVICGLFVYPEGPKRLGLQLPAVFESLPFQLGLDLQGGAYLVYEADVSQVPAGEERAALEGVRDVIERRVNAFGVSEPVVQTSKTDSHWRVSVELAGVTDVTQAIAMIGETPLLEFRIQNPNPTPTLTEEQTKELEAFNADALKKAESVLKEALVPNADFTALAKTYSQEPNAATTGGDLGLVARTTFVKEFEAVCFDQLRVGQISNKVLTTEFGHHLIKKIAEEGSGEAYKAHCAHILFDTKSAADYAKVTDGWLYTGLTGKQLTRAQVVLDQVARRPQVSLTFNDEGAQKFAELTRANIGKSIAIFLDGEPISIPTVQQEITQGQAVISGSFSITDARTLAQRLNAGALPVPIELVSQQKVGASLGSESTQRSLQAGIAGLLAVSLFMILMYRYAGVIAILALLCYLAFLLLAFKLIPITLTLSGVAGLILSLGIAVDANVLIFERLKEELRAGKGIDQALGIAFKRALPSIIDGNASTLITCVVLIGFTTSIVRGFAITLGIGIILSLFTAIVVTRLFFLSLSRVRFLQKPWLYGANFKSKV